jgi:formate hydrogenlyase transcriptional activator
MHTMMTPGLDFDLAQQVADLRRIVDLVPAFIHTALPDGSHDFFNRTWLDFVGAKEEDMLGWKWLACIHPDDLERFNEKCRRAVATGENFVAEARIRRFDGHYCWMIHRKVPRKDENGKVLAWYGTSVNVEPRKLAELRLQRALTEIEKLKEHLEEENIALREEVDKLAMFEEIIGTSPALAALLVRLAKVAPTNSTVLITGETGTGKELIARAIHKHSHRANRPFVSVNCAAIPRDLIASELFGHEKGAFTGAVQRRLGRFELAEGGTLFLDEVGELPPETQVALLRVLQEREFERVGGSSMIHTDVRVISATNRDLEAAVAAGTFRSDLYYRLNVFPIALPPLRERQADISLLAEYFISSYARKMGKKIRAINKRSLELLHNYSWPGNIRELKNVIERSLILCDTETFSIDESWLSQQPLATKAAALPEFSKTLAAHEKEIIETALKESGGRVSGPSGAAAKLGIARSTLESKIKALRIDKNRFKPAAD